VREQMRTMDARLERIEAQVERIDASVFRRGACGDRARVRARISAR
jgi:hypothetical protein